MNNPTMTKIESRIAEGVVHIVVEGADGSGKTTILAQMFQILHNAFPYRVALIRNPSNVSLYNKMHAGHLDPFQTAMSTLADGVDAYLSALDIVNRHGIILQDRSAITSGSLYNYPYMNVTRSGMWYRAAEDVVENTITDPIGIVLTGQLREESNRYSKTAQYRELIENRRDMFGNPYIPYQPIIDNVYGDAVNIINIIEGEIE